MKEIIIEDQKEWNELPERFENYTIIKIQCENRIIIDYCPGNSSVVARGNSSVGARGNSSVEARGNSSVEARGNSSVEAWDNSSVVAWDYSSVEAWGNSSVEARDYSSVVAWGNSSVVAWDYSSVEAWGNSSVEAWGNSVVRSYSERSSIELSMQTVCVCYDCDPSVKLVGSEPVVIKRERARYDFDSFVAVHKLTVSDEHVELYKVTTHDGFDYRTRKIKYEGIVICPDWDPDSERECGGGLHLSPTPGLALRYNTGPVLRCRVHKDDIAVYPYSVDKVRCRRVEVVGSLEQ